MSETTNEGITEHEFAQSVMSKIQAQDAGTSEAETPAADTSEEPAAETTEVATEETTEEPVYTEDANGNLHGPDGKFVEKSQRTGDENVAGTTEEEETTEEEPAAESDDDVITLEIDDPEVAAFLQKYDGDLDKALRGAAELQKMSGRQGGELGELRNELQQMKQAIERGMQPQVDYTSRLDRVAEIEDDAQRSEAYQGLAEHAANAGDFESMAEVVREWKEEDPFAASMFSSTLIAQFERDAMLEQLQAQAPAPAAADDQAAVNVEVSKVVERHPDIEKFLPQIGEIAKERPYLEAALQKGSPQERASALEDLYLLARSRETDTSSAAIQRIQVKTRQDNERAKADAAVVSGSRSSNASADQPTKADEFKAKFRKAAGLPDLEVE